MFSTGERDSIPISFPKLTSLLFDRLELCLEIGHLHSPTDPRDSAVKTSSDLFFYDQRKYYRR